MKVQKKFVRYISHEIRTPLSAVKMGLQYLLAEITNVTQDREILDSLETTELAVIAAINILNDLLTFDKIEEGKLKLDRQVISARDLLISSTTIFLAQVTTSVQLNGYMFPRVKTAFSTQSFNTNLLLALSLLGHLCGLCCISLQARQKDVALSCHLFEYESSALLTGVMVGEGGDRDVLVNVDRNKLSQVIHNMVSNAIKFTPSGGQATVIATMESDSTLDNGGGERAKGAAKRRTETRS